MGEQDRTEHPNYQRATERERRTICWRCGRNMDGSWSHTGDACEPYVDEADRASDRKVGR